MISNQRMTKQNFAGNEKTIEKEDVSFDTRGSTEIKP